MKNLKKVVEEVFAGWLDDGYRNIVHERNDYKTMANYNKSEVERLQIELREIVQLKIDIARKDNIIRILKRENEQLKLAATASTLVPR